MFSTKVKKEENKVGKNNNRRSFDAFKNPEILEVNLVKDEVVIFFDWNKSILAIILVLILSSLFVFQIYLGLDYWERRENEKALLIEQETNLLKSEIADLNNKAKDALSFKDKSSAFSDILNNHVYWTRFFSWLERNTLSTVSYNGFSGDLSGSYSLAATTPSYAEASWQVKAFSDSPIVKNVMVESVSSKLIEVETGQDLDPVISNEVSFNIELELEPDIFKKN